MKIHIHTHTPNYPFCSLRSYLYRALGPVLVLLLIALAPIGKAAEIIPGDEGKKAPVADTIPPDDVENVKVTAGDQSATLKWNVATDDVAVKGYKVYYGTISVGTEKGKYNLGSLDAGNVISYTVDKLTNGTKYFFAVTAYDTAGNESPSYSIEVNATPGRGAADKEAPKDAPKVMKAETVDKSHVKIVFSKAVKLSTTSPESSFNIKNDSTGGQLEVKGAVMDAADKSNISAIVETSAQQPGASYILTVGINVKDLAGNPIISGTSDTAVFTGTDIEPKVASKEEVLPKKTETEKKEDVSPKQETEQLQESVTQELIDKTAPEDVRNFTAKMLKQLILSLNWTKSLNKAGDLANYVLYMATEKNKYGEGIVVTSNADSFDVTDIVPDVKYFFKLTAKDNAGNESVGAETTFVLPGTGPELILLLLGSLGAGKYLTRRRKGTGLF